MLYGAIPPDLPLVTHLLHDAGYHVGFTGKGWAPGDWKAAGLQRHPLVKEYNSKLLANSPSPGVFNGDYASNFAAFLEERPAGAPFFFWLGSKEPHRGYERGYGLRKGKRLQDAEVPEFLPDAEEVRGDLLDYAAEVEWFDEQIGAALEVLKRSGELERTLIVATSDNGLPFPRAKGNLYDWGVRMPLAIRWGAGIRASGRVVEEFCSHTDFAPTFLEAARLPVPSSMSGRSLLPLLDGAADASRDCAFTSLERHVMARPEGATYPMRAIRTKEFLYIRNYAPDRWPAGGDFVSSNKTAEGDVDEGPTKTYVMAHRGRHAQLSFGKRPAEELYEINKDPAQIHNVAGEPLFAKEKAKLAARLEDMLRKTGDPRMEGKDPWQSYVYRQTDGFGASFNRSLSEAARRAAVERATHKPE